MHRAVISGVLLAAGSGSRFGGEKLLYPVGGRPMVTFPACACVASGLDEVVAVVPPRADELERVLHRYDPGGNRLRVVQNDDAGRGMMTSVQTGLRSVSPRSEAAMIVLGDMPCVRAFVIDRLIREFARTGGIVIPECEGELRHPRVIPRRFFDEFLSLDGDARGSAVIDRHADEVTTVAVGTPSDFADIDHPQDVEAWMHDRLSEEAP